MTSKHEFSYLETYKWTPKMPFVPHFTDLTSLEVKMEVNDLQWGQTLDWSSKFESSCPRTYKKTPSMLYVLHFTELTSLEVKMEVKLDVNDLLWCQTLDWTSKFESSCPKTYKWTPNIWYIISRILPLLKVKMEVSDLQWG